MSDEMRSQQRQGLENLSAKDWVYSHTVRLEPSDLPPSLKDVIFIKRSEMDLGNRVGGGSFGEVYRGSLDNQKVAVKIFKIQNSVARVGQLMVTDDGLDIRDQKSDGRKRIVDVVEQLVREVRVLKSISFGRIVKFHGVCLEPASIVTEFCPNKSLFDYIGLARSDPKYAETLTWKRRLQIAYDAASGMHYLHSRENDAIVHRDLKSPNLLLDENMNCKICDFNTAKFVGTKAVTNSISANNPLWLAPEILQGNPFTRSSDVYPFGIILWELMTLMVPFELNCGEPKNMHAVMFGVVLKDYRPDIPRNEDLIGGPCPVYECYCQLMEQCWHREPRMRPTFAAIKNTLKKLLETESQPASSTQMKSKSVPERPERPERFARSARFLAPIFKNSLLKRSKHMSRDIEQQIKLNNPDIEAAWKDSDEDVMRDVDQLPTPFAKGSCPRMSDESYPDEHPATPGGHFHAADSPDADKASGLLADLSNASVKSRGIQGISSAKTTADGRWNKIRDVVRLISARKRAHEMQSMLGLKSVTETSVSSISPAEVTHGEKAGNQQSTEENQPVNSIADVQPRKSKWKVLKQQFCPSVSQATHHEYWDTLVRHLSVTTQLHTSQSLRPKSPGIESSMATHPVATPPDATSSTNAAAPMATSKRTAANWALVKETLQLNGLEGYPGTPESWRPLLNVLFPSENSDTTLSQSVQRRADMNGTSKSSVTEDQIEKWLLEHDLILRKHKGFLQSVSTEMGKSSSADSSLKPNLPAQHESARTKRNFASQDMWDFVRDCLLETSLPSAWDPVIKFMRDCTNISSQDLGTLRDLMSRADEDQTHEVSGILKPLVFLNE